MIRTASENRACISETRACTSETRVCTSEIRMASKELVSLPWLRYFIVFGQNPPPLTSRQWTVIGLLSLCGFFSSYDGQIFTLALPRIQKDLGILDKDVSFIGSLIALGNLFGLPLLLGADRCGRKQILLHTVFPYSVLTGLTAFSHSYLSFAIYQFGARIFLSVEVIVSHVVIIEEMPKESRGWAVGVISACSTLGNGLAILMFGIIGDRSGSWRALYALAVVPLFFLAYLRRFLPETTRFKGTASQNMVIGRASLDEGAMQSASAQTKDVAEAGKRSMLALAFSIFSPLVQLLQESRGMAMSVFLLAFIDCFSMGPHGLYDFKYLQEAHGFAAQHVSVLGILGGLMALGMYTHAGDLSDRFGRRKLLSVFYFIHCILTVIYYLATGSLSRFISLIWTVRVAFAMGLGTMGAAISTEVFPTSRRSTAQSLWQIATSIGKPSGIFIEGLLVSSSWVSTHWQGTAVVACFQVVCVFLVMGCFPETAGRELEEIDCNVSRDVTVTSAHDMDEMANLDGYQ